jgi:hypothetical protein
VQFDKDKLDANNLTLPAYVILRKEGVFIDISPLPSREILQKFIDLLFTNESRFEGLDYAVFMELLFGEASELQGMEDLKGSKEIRLASGIVRFPPERMALYRGIKLSVREDRAEYMFEPVFMEVGDTETKKPELRPTRLDFDEFVAYAWTKGVCYGIDANAVREAISEGMTLRMDCAFQREPTESIDAYVVEENKHLRRDNTPLILPDGKADLRRAKNRFPQIAKDEPMLRKVPRVTGKHGYKVTGAIIEPRIPKDVNLAKFIGEGVHIENTPKGELLVASIEGFLVVDHTGAIHVTTKIENKDGISAKATGDIALTVNQYTEHGEVQEGRNVEGIYMTFLDNVFGNIVSKGGDIELSKNLSGGSARTSGKNIIIRGRVINSTVEARKGHIDIEYAERSLIIGKNILIRRAVNCEILAEELELGITEGCAIAGRKLQFNSTNVSKDKETLITVILPDVADFDRKIDLARLELKEIEQAIQVKNQEIAATQPGFAKFLAIIDGVREGTVRFTSEQQAVWQDVVSQFAPLAKRTDGLVKKHQALEETIKQMVQARADCGAGEFCKIGQVLGSTVGRVLNTDKGMLVFNGLQETEIRLRLREIGNVQNYIFTGEHGEFDWHFCV